MGVEPYSLQLMGAEWNCARIVLRARARRN